MTPAHGHAPARAEVLRVRGAALPPGGPTSAILDSWVRSTRAGLDPARPPMPDADDAHALARRRDRIAPVRRLAAAEIETLLRQIAGSNFLLAFADADGVILDLHADNRFRMQGSAAGIVAGSCWSEARCGTNGLGMALATGAPASVDGPEHFFFAHGDIACTAAPIRDARGELVGVLDASSYVSARQRHTEALVRMAALRLENLLLARDTRGHLLVAVHPRASFLGTLECGLAAFDGEGRLVAMNARLDEVLAPLRPVRGMRFDALFAEDFTARAAGLRGETELTVHDLSGRPVSLRCVHGLPVATPGQRGAAALRVASAPDERGTGRHTMVADDPAVAEAVRLVDAAVRLRVPVLIQGETGTGKELLARHAHASSGRQGAFVAVNCGAMPAELFEAELFGYASGAFTGARREGNAGLIEAADGGTLLLDEIVELPLPLQAALLRFLDDQHVRPVGGRQARRVDVQVLAATHADLPAEVAARRFRADLLHRLNVVRVCLPPLHARQDFEAVARRLLAEIDASATLDAEALALLAAQPWPGNMRELRAVLTRALLLHPTGRLQSADVAARLPPTAAPMLHSALQQSALQRVLSEFARTGGSVSQTSRNLGVSRTTVYRYLRAGTLRPDAA